jgi:hypothetical protein
MVPFWHYLPWIISPVVGAGVGLSRRIAPAKNQPSRRGLGLVCLITMLTRDKDRCRTGLELARVLGRDDLTGTTSYVDPPPPPVPPPEEP